MPNVRVPFLRLTAWPLEGLLAALGLLAAGVAVGLGLGGVVSPLVGGLAGVCGVVLAVLSWKGQATAARLANQLCRDDGAPRRSLVGALKQISVQLDGHERRAANTHPTTGLPTREHLAEHIAADLRAPQGQMLLGGLRFTDFDRLAAFDLREEEALADQRAGHRQHGGQPAHGLHRRVEVEHRMAPVRAARHGPAVRRHHARIERGVQRGHPVGGDRLSQQGIAVPLQS